MDWAEFRKGYSFAVGLKPILACTCAAIFFAMTANIHIPSSLCLRVLVCSWPSPTFLLCETSQHKHAFMAHP